MASIFVFVIPKQIHQLFLLCHPIRRHFHNSKTIYFSFGLCRFPLGKLTLARTNPVNPGAGFGHGRRRRALEVLHVIRQLYINTAQATMQPNYPRTATPTDLWFLSGLSADLSATKMVLWADIFGAFDLV